MNLLRVGLVCFDGFGIGGPSFRLASTSWTAGSRGMDSYWSFLPPGTQQGNEPTEAKKPFGMISQTLGVRDKVEDVWLGVSYEWTPLLLPCRCRFGCSEFEPRCRNCCLIICGAKCHCGKMKCLATRRHQLSDSSFAGEPKARLQAQ